MSTDVAATPQSFTELSPRMTLSHSPSSCSSTSSSSQQHVAKETPSEILSSPVSSSSTDDEEGVFFGAHDPRERDFFAQLANYQPSSASTPTASPRPLRLRKRDSTEILRRKSLLHSVQKTAGPRRSVGEPKKWEGGFYERLEGILNNDEDESDASSSPHTPPKQHHLLQQSPSRPGAAGSSDLTLDFSVFAISDSAVRNRARATEAEELSSTGDEVGDDEDSSEASDMGDSDKENVVLPISPESDSEDEDIGPERLEEVTLGFGSLASIQSSDSGSIHTDSADHLDMGGLHLSDFADPEDGYEDTVPPEAVLADFYDDATDSDDGATYADVTVRAALAEISLGADESASPELVFSHSEAEVGGFQTFMPSRSLASPTESERSTSVLVEGESPIGNTQLDQTVGTDSSLTQNTPVAATTTHPSSTEDVSTDPIYATVLSQAHPNNATPSSSSSMTNEELDSPLPVARGGPVIIPQLASHRLSIRAEMGSPFRSLPSGPSQVPEIDKPPLNDTTPTVRLAQLDSPDQRTPAHTLPRVVEQLPTTSSDVTPSLTRAPQVPTGVRGNKVLKNSLVPGSADRAALAKSTIEPSKKAIARALVIREQLASAVSGPGKLGMGPPRRTISGSSASSATSTTSSASSAQRPPSRIEIAVRPAPTSQSTGHANARVVSQSQRAVPRAPAPSSMAGPPRSALAGHRCPAKTTPAIATTSRDKTLSKGLARPVPRPALAPRPIGTAGMATMARPNTHLSDRKSMRPPLTVGIRAAVMTNSAPVRSAPPHVIVSPPRAISTSGSNPLKRPLPSQQSAHSRPLLAVGASGTRPALGMPSRLVRDMTIGHGVPVFSIGVAGEGGYGSAAAAVGRARFGSPRTHGIAKRGLICSPAGPRSFKLGTPSRLGTPGRRTPASATAMPPILNYSNGPTSAPNVFAPIASGTREATEVHEVEVALEAQNIPRGSSEDHEDVSFVLSLGPGPHSPSDTGSPPGKVDRRPVSANLRGSGSPVPSSSSSSPAAVASADEAQTSSSTPATGASQSANASSRPKRAVRPPPTLAATSSAKGRPAPAASIAPNMSEKELKTATERNTMANQVYRYCAIDRQVVHIPGPRPPSPTSKIPKSADREEEEKKGSRSERAKRRSEGDGGDEAEGEGDSTGEATEARARETGEEVGVRVVETVQVSRWQGEDEDYKTPQRATKKAKMGNGKGVRWDRGLVIIRDDGVLPLSRHASRSASAPVEGNEGSGGHEGHEGDARSRARRSSMRRRSQIQLDQHGNVVAGSRPDEPLKKQRLVVTAVFYEGEEEPPYKPTYMTLGQETGVKGQAKGKGKKK